MSGEENAQVDLDIELYKSCGFVQSAATMFLYGPVSLKCKPYVQVAWPEGSIEGSGADLQKSQLQLKIVVTF